MVALRGRGWGLAPCLVDLVLECDEIAPNRSTVSDGSVGDLSHQARQSDHNPDDGWVCAVDITDDKPGGCDADLLARHIVASRDPRVKYVIWNGTIAKSYPSNGHRAWEPQPYTGSNPHDKHTHVSVHNTADARNDLSPWWPQVSEEDDMKPEEVAMLKRVLAVTERCHDALGLDGLADAHGNVKGRVDALYLDMKLGANGGGDVDLGELVAAVKALPAQTVKALKDAL